MRKRLQRCTSWSVMRKRLQRCIIMICNAEEITEMHYHDLWSSQNTKARTKRPGSLNDPPSCRTVCKKYACFIGKIKIRNGNVAGKVGVFIKLRCYTERGRSALREIHKIILNKHGIKIWNGFNCQLIRETDRFPWITNYRNFRKCLYRLRNYQVAVRTLYRAVALRLSN